MKHRVLSHYEPYKNRASAYRLFFQESIRSLGPTASMFPSSRYLANALTRPIDFRRARTVVELGPGTGAVTKEILKHLRPDGKLSESCRTERRLGGETHRAPHVLFAPVQRFERNDGRLLHAQQDGIAL